MMFQDAVKLGRVITRTQRHGLRLTPQPCRSGARPWFSSTAKADNAGKKDAKKGDGSLFFFRAGLPLVLFSCLGVWVVSNGIQGKLKERDAFTGRTSKSEREANLEKEHDEMVDKLNEFVNRDFDNTKRIQRPEEILEQRRKERTARNAWYRRWGRWVTGQE